MEEMELLLPRAKKEVWERRRVVRVTAVGERSIRASEVRLIVLFIDSGMTYRGGRTVP
jgi:hypothetical protein